MDENNVNVKIEYNNIFIKEERDSDILCEVKEEFDISEDIDKEQADVDVKVELESCTTQTFFKPIKLETIINEDTLVHSVAEKAYKIKEEPSDHDNLTDGFEHGEGVSEGSETFVNKETGDTIIKCYRCDKWFAEKAHLERHMTEHLPLTLLACDKCNQNYGSHCNLTENMAVQTELKKHKGRVLHIPYKCCQCDETFKTIITLRRHILMHLGDKPFKCHKCNKSYLHNRSLQYHIATHKPFECSECDKSFINETKLENHMAKHAIHECNQCDRTFSEEYNLKCHIFNAHKCHKCSECDKIFTNKVHLKAHMATHTDKYFQCNECNRSFLHRKHLISHMALHTGDKSFKCNDCDKRFVRKINLNNHMAVHTGREPYKCNKCDRSFFYKMSFKKHLQTHIA